ncbi:MAG: PEGA domain-containing protein, partial [Bradymonadaceae bacterium]
YELLTLERLFLGESDFDTLEKIRKVEMSPPSLYNPHIPKGLEDIVLKALARTPEERYQTTFDLAEALERFMRTQGYYYTNKDLASYMKEAFSADIEFENKKLDYYRTLNLKPIVEDETPVNGRRAKTGGGLEWGEDEMETQIFDRLAAEDVGESDIIYAEDVHHEEDPPTVEFDRWEIDLDLAPPRTDDFAVEEPSSRRVPQPTAQLEAVDRRGDRPQVTVPSAAVLPEPTSGSGGRLGIIALVAAIVIIAGLSYLFITQDRTAMVVFETQPQHVQILINDEIVYDGETPFSIKSPAGEATIVIQQEGFETFSRSVAFERGKTYELNQTLKRLTFENTGLALKTTPEGATVKVGDTLQETTTPLTLSELAPGKYELTISMDGYFDETMSVDVKAEEISELEVALRPAKVELTVNSQPDRAQYSVFEQGGEKSLTDGRTPDTVELAGGKTYRIVVERRGYEDWEQTFEPGTEASPTLNAELERTRQAEIADRAPTVRPDPVRTNVGTAVRRPDPPPKTQPKVEEPAGTGTVSIASRPVARVYINDQDTGRYTPLIDFKIKSGRHKIGLVNPEFGLDKTYYVDLKPGEAKRIINR